MTDAGKASPARPAARAGVKRGQHPARVTLRQLCQLGLPAPSLLPPLLPLLRELVPAAHAGFFFCDALGNITNLYAERLLPPQDMARYHDSHGDQQFRQQYLQRLAASSPVSWRSVTEAERASPYYRDVLAPLGVEHFLYAIVRQGQQALGQLSLYRSAGQPAFSAEDAQTLGGLLHYLANGLGAAAPTAPADVFTHADEEGLAVLDDQGRELYADSQWPRLLRLAHGDTIAPARALAEADTLPRFTARLLAAVRRAPGGVHRVTSAWGQFAFRGHALHAAHGAEAVALRVSRMAPEPLRLAQGAAALRLSPQQREVAVLMAQGYSNAAIAESLNVSTNTASYHAKQVFLRLGVHERSAIAKALAAAASPA